MTPEQEIRAKALELSMNYYAIIANGMIQANRSMTASVYKDIDEVVEYITKGTKPKVKE